MGTSSRGLRTSLKTLSPARRIRLARDLWGWKPHPTQREWLLDRHRVKVAACGRRWGKTEAAAIDVATYAIANNGSVQMIVAPTYDQSKLISSTVERLLLSKDEIRRHVQVTKTPYPDIRYRNSRIMARTADDDGRNLRGHAADRVVVDEAAFVRDQVVEEVIGPMLADRNGQLVMASTPFGKNHFYRAFLRGQLDGGATDHPPFPCREGGQGGRSEPHPRPLPEAERGIGRCRSFRFPSWANPHISREYIEYQRSILTDRQFKVEYEAEFVDDQNSVFPWADIQAAVCDSGTRRWGDGANPEFAVTNHESRVTCVAGIDWARYSDYTAVVIVAVSDRPFDGLRTGQSAAGARFCSSSAPAERCSRPGAHPIHHVPSEGSERPAD